MRVLLKLSGEALMGKLSFGISQDALHALVKQIIPLQKEGHEVGIVVGGGNLFRGLQGVGKLGIERTPADQIGMLATMMNGILLNQALLYEGCDSLVMTALECPLVAERYNWAKANAFLSQGKLLVFVGGTGHPYFTTDTAAALRASEIKADILLKATTRVDGVYDKDPLAHEGAKKFDTLSYSEFVEMKLGVMDLTALTLCMTSRIPIRIFNLYKGSFIDALSEKPLGSLIK